MAPCPCHPATSQGLIHLCTSEKMRGVGHFRKTLLSIFSVRDDYRMNDPAGKAVLLPPQEVKNNEIHLFRILR